MSTWILRLHEGTGGLRVAVKDLVDVAGLPTTAGCRAVARTASPASADAACLAGVRDAVAAGRATLVGKTNLHELAAGATGINPWYGTPTNPLAAELIPGGSSSGSAVAVASGEADVAVGTDTGGSVRIPAACCGIVGLKTTWGRIPTTGVWPLAPSLDTVGPMGADVDAVVAGMALLEPGFAPGAAPSTVGRVRLPAPPSVDRAIDEVLDAAGLEVTEVAVPGWAAAGDATLTVLAAEAWQVDRDLLSDTGVSADLRDLIGAAAGITSLAVGGARSALRAWRDRLVDLIGRHGPLVVPTLTVEVPSLAAGDPGGRLLLATAPVNGPGLPALAVPVPRRGGLPASIQLVGAPGGEEELVALGAVIEAATR